MTIAGTQTIVEVPAPAIDQLIDVEAIQSLLKDFHALTHIPVSIIDLEGRILVGVGWQDICSRFHRMHPETCRNCIESDTKLSAGINQGEYKLYKCRNNLWDVATPLMIDGRKAANIFSGQFFFEDEEIDRDWFVRQAERYGFERERYLAALDAVPRVRREDLEIAMRFFVRLGRMVAVSGLRRVQLEKSLADLDAVAESLRERGELLQRAQQIAQLGSWTLDLVSGVLSWSDEVYRIFGLQPQQFAATYEAFLERVHPEDRDVVDRAYGESLATKLAGYELTHRLVRADTGEVRWVHEKCSHVRDGDGRVIRSIGMVQDITERRRIEEELQSNNSELMRANRELEEFAFVASHDLREPLRTINIYAQKLLRRPGLEGDAEAAQCSNFIRMGVTRMDELIRDLLNYSRAVHEERNPPGLTADLNQSLESAIAVLGGRIGDTGASIESSGLPRVYADQGQIGLVFQNLLSNSMKYVDRGTKPEIRISAERQDGCWRITVRDNGIGFDGVHAERIFGLFKRLHRNEYSGTGVGLSICKRIVERYGGRIWAESDGPDCGASFHFVLRACDSPTNAVEPPAARNSALP